MTHMSTTASLTWKCAVVIRKLDTLVDCVGCAEHLIPVGEHRCRGLLELGQSEGLELRDLVLLSHQPSILVNESDADLGRLASSQTGLTLWAIS